MLKIIGAKDQLNHAGFTGSLIRKVNQMQNYPREFLRSQVQANCLLFWTLYIATSPLLWR